MDQRIGSAPSGNKENKPHCSPCRYANELRRRTATKGACLFLNLCKLKLNTGRHIKWRHLAALPKKIASIYSLSQFMAIDHIYCWSNGSVTVFVRCFL